MILGSLGPVVFSVSGLRVLNFNNFSRTSKKRTARHEVIGGKPRLEMLGADLDTLTFDIRLDVMHGVQPRSMLTLLRQMAEQKLTYLLVIGGRPIGENLWCVDSVSEAWDTVLNAGELVSATVKLSLTEYVPML